jgi:uncharacterized protein YbjT (DUF2867 family)
MRIVVVGGTGLIGGALVKRLAEDGHEAVAASRATGVDVIAGEGLSDALEGADVVVDTLNTNSVDPDEILRFFRHSGHVLLDGIRRAGVKHHVVLSALGADRLSLSGFFLGKLLQENLVRASGTPYTIIRSAPFFETIYGIATDADNGSEIRLPPRLVQPIAADDVVLALADVALSQPANRVLEVAGPEAFRLTDLALEVLTAYEDMRRILPDVHAPYFGAEMGPEKLVPENPWWLATARFDDWLRNCLATA